MEGDQILVTRDDGRGVARDGQLKRPSSLGSPHAEILSAGLITEALKLGNVQSGETLVFLHGQHDHVPFLTSDDLPAAQSVSSGCGKVPRAAFASSGRPTEDTPMLQPSNKKPGYVAFL